jgi:Arc/MetJ-type ribon-helix-helix transcriptional regulator
MTNSQTVALRLPPEDLALLDLLTEKEERSRSDVIRRALRAYAKSTGVEVKASRKRK